MVTVKCFVIQLDAKYFSRFGKLPGDVDMLDCSGDDINSFADYHLAVTNGLYYYVVKHITHWWYDDIIGIDARSNVFSCFPTMFDELDHKLEEVCDILEELFSDNAWANVEAITWANHLSHMSGEMLTDYAGIRYSLIDRISQNGIGEVFEDTPV